MTGPMLIARYPVRLDCGHMVTYVSTFSLVGEVVHCTRCDGPARVAHWYFPPGHANGRRDVLCAARGDGFPEPRCTLAAGHGEEKHFDQPLGVYFARSARRLRSGAEGNCRRA